MARYTLAEHDAFAAAAIRDGFVILPGHFPADKIQAWKEAFRPLLDEHIAREGHLANRGSSRYYVTLPFEGLWADPTVYEDDDVLAIVGKLVGDDGVMCQLATDTPMRGSDYQDIHRDTPPLFPEWGRETPPYQLALNFPLVDVTYENGPIEIAAGTHMLDKADAMQRLEAGEFTLKPYPMNAGDLMIRDVRGLHRGTPNNTDEPRPMVVIGYSRRWLLRPEVRIDVPRATHEGLSERAKAWLRFNPIVERVEPKAAEVYQSFSY